MSSPFSTSPIESGGGGGGVTGLLTADAGNPIADNEIIRGDGTTGIQGSTVTMDDSGNINAGAGVLTSGNFPASSTDNAVARYDSTTGKLIQSSDLSIADVAAGSVAVATTIGNSLTIAATAPAATTGASVAGKTIGITASPAVASTDTAGAAAGGSVTITTGNAARNASGNADGGDLVVIGGSGIGSGIAGRFLWKPAAGAVTTVVMDDASLYLNRNSNDPKMAAGPSGTVPGFTFANDTNTGVGTAGADLLSLIAGGVEIARANEGVTGESNGLTWLRSVDTNASGPVTVNATVADTGKVYANTGAAGSVTFSLPAAAVGLEYYFVVVADEDVVVDAAGSDTIRIAGSVSGAGGTATNGTTGGTLHLICPVAGAWYALDAPNGTWTLSA